MNNYYPSYIINDNNSEAYYHFDRLFRMLYILFDFDNLPEGWDNNYIKTVIFNYGFCGVFKNTIIGPRPLWCAIREVDYRYRPSKLGYANWALGEGEGLIGKDCELIYTNYLLTPNIVTVAHYAKILANIDASVITNLYNTRLSTVFFANSESEKKTLYGLVDAVTAGNPAVVLSSKYQQNLRDRIVDLNSVKNTYIGDLLHEQYRNVFNRFLTEIGIQNTAYEKNERLTTAESTSNNVEVYLVNNNLIKNLQECIDRVNELLGTDIKVISTVEKVGEYVSNSIINTNSDGAEKNLEEIR